MERVIKNTMTKGTASVKPSSDPRIDSPDIKVVYPSIPREIPKQTPVESQEQKVKLAQTTSTPVSEVAETSERKISWQDAITQNSTVFLIIGLLVFGIGFMIGKK